MANKKGVEHNRLLLTYWMMKGGMSPFEAWEMAGKKIKRSLAQLNRRKKSYPTTEEMVDVLKQEMGIKTEERG